MFAARYSRIVPRRIQGDTIDRKGEKVSASNPRNARTKGWFSRCQVRASRQIAYKFRYEDMSACNSEEMRDLIDFDAFLTPLENSHAFKSNLPTITRSSVDIGGAASNYGMLLEER